CDLDRFVFFFFSSRRRHTRSVSAFLLNRSSDLEFYRFHDAEISESVNFCVMEAIKLCRLDTPIIFIEARINLSRFVVTGCAAKTSATRAEGRRVGKESRYRWAT